MQNTPLEQLSSRFSPLLTRTDNNDNLLEVMNNSLNNNLLESQKQNIKEVKIKTVEKTQRIKKDRKVEKKSLPKQETSNNNQVDQLLIELVKCAVEKLKIFMGSSGGSGVSKLPVMDEESVLQFLQLIEFTYSETVAIYMCKNKNSWGSEISVKSRFAKEIMRNFQILQKLVYYMAVEHYDSGKHQLRFESLMRQNITPIIHLESMKYLQVECTDWYLQKHPSQAKIRQTTEQRELTEAEHQDDFDPSGELQADSDKTDKRKRKNKKKKQKKEKKEEEWLFQNEKDEALEQMTKFLQSMSVKQEERVECRIDEELLEHWKDLISKLCKSVSKSQK